MRGPSVCTRDSGVSVSCWSFLPARGMSDCCPPLLIAMTCVLQELVPLRLSAC